MPVLQVAVAVLLPKANDMFPEGAGAPRAMAKDGTAAKKTNELLVNAREAIDELWKQRGYDPKKPEETKAKLGYALDREEAVGYVVTGAMHLPRLSPEEARTIGKRVVSIVGASGCSSRSIVERAHDRCPASGIAGGGGDQHPGGPGAGRRLPRASQGVPRPSGLEFVPYWPHPAFGCYLRVLAPFSQAPLRASWRPLTASA